MYKILFEKEAQRSLKKMDKYQANLILAWISKNLNNCDNPRRLGKPLLYNNQSNWRYRVGNYRILTEIQEEHVVILIV